MIKPAPEVANATSIPPELWIIISEYLDSSDIRSVSAASRYLHWVTRNKSVWRRECFKLKLTPLSNAFETVRNYHLSRKVALEFQMASDNAMHEHGISAIDMHNENLVTAGWDGKVKFLDRRMNLKNSVDPAAGMIHTMSINDSWLILGHQLAPFITLYEIQTFKKQMLANPPTKRVVSVDLNDKNWMFCTENSLTAPNTSRSTTDVIVTGKFAGKYIVVMYESGRIEIELIKPHYEDIPTPIDSIDGIFFTTSEIGLMSGAVQSHLSGVSIAAGYKDGSLRTWEFIEGTFHSSREISASPSSLSAIAFHNGLVIVANWVGNIIIWNPDVEETQVVVKKTKSAVISLLVTDGRMYTGHYDGSLRSWK